jgi:hypothetical protein
VSGRGSEVGMGGRRAGGYGGALIS